MGRRGVINISPILSVRDSHLSPPWEKTTQAGKPIDMHFLPLSNRTPRPTLSLQRPMRLKGLRAAPLDTDQRMSRGRGAGGGAGTWWAGRASCISGVAARSPFAEAYGSAFCRRSKAGDCSIRLVTTMRALSTNPDTEVFPPADH